MSGDEQRWTLYGSSMDGKWSVADRCPAPPVPPMMIQFVSVEVMPVSEHEAALAAARQVDDVMIERAAEALDLPAEMGCVCRWDDDGNPPPDCRCNERRLEERRRIARAALLAALNAPRSEETP